MIFVYSFVQYNHGSMSNNSLTSCGRPTSLGILLRSSSYLGGTFPFVPRLHHQDFLGSSLNGKIDNEV